MWTPAWLLFAIAVPLAAGQFDAARALIRKQIADGQVPSIAVAVAREGKIIWEEGFGLANREKKQAATPHTMYSLASISKPITATGLMVLKERGKIDLDRPINEYLGDAKLKGWAFNAAEATVRRVANHTSGLPLHYQFFYADEPYRRPPMDETIRRYGNLMTRPGEAYQYSNLGYGVIDYVISRVSGRPYPEFMRDEVFRPLGLTHMSVDVPRELEDHAAARYSTDGRPIPFYDFDHPGGSAIWSSAHDLVRFAMFHMQESLPDQKPVLSKDAIAEMQNPTGRIADKIGYGVGWDINDTRGFRMVSHGGSMGGVTTTLNMAPAKRIAVVVLCNTGSARIAQISNEIFAALDFPRPAQGGGSGGEPKGPDFTGRWSGKVHTYKEEIPLIFDFKPGSDIHVRLGTQLWTLLNQVRWEDGVLQGRMTGDIGTDDANRRSYTLRLVLRLRGTTLNGSMTSISNPAPKPGNALSHWVELEKQK